MRPLKRIIDLNALRHNWAVLDKQSGTAKMIAVVKANAYGHGVEAVAKALPADYFAVACCEEAQVLRHIGITAPVMLLEGIFSADELALCAAQNFHPVIHNHVQLQWLGNRVDSKKLSAWIKIDSGMHRLGFLITELPQVIAHLSSISGVDWQGVVSHFACADADDLSHATAQLSALKQCVLPAKWKRSYANSAAIFTLPEAQVDWVRPGVLLYGMSPFSSGTARSLELQPVMTLETQIIAVRHLKKGESAGYGQGFYAPCDGFLATIALGYGDGFSRTIPSGKAPVWIEQHEYPLVGRIAMDMSLVWLGNNWFDVGTQVEIFGRHLPVEKLAACTNTIPHTLTTMLQPRVHIELIDGES